MTCAVLPSAKSRFHRPLSAPQPLTQPPTASEPRSTIAPPGSEMSRNCSVVRAVVPSGELDASMIELGVTLNTPVKLSSSKRSIASIRWFAKLTDDTITDSRGDVAARSPAAAASQPYHQPKSSLTAEMESPTARAP